MSESCFKASPHDVMVNLYLWKENKLMDVGDYFEHLYGVTPEFAYTLCEYQFFSTSLVSGYIRAIV